MNVFCNDNFHLHSNMDVEKYSGFLLYTEKFQTLNNSTSTVNTSQLHVWERTSVVLVN